ncbi:MAG: class I SAM-dependent rRNA methyltransferase [Chloroflexi bacterium]|nr:class I SAM-dependent rRNA methyltransferase [Chloroflexota bacterium]MBU1750308.1 class I SAM-dependent rRNA methyltransferase [Chloroflexota bacterium]
MSAPPDLLTLVQHAVARRDPLARHDPATTVYRLVHGAGDGLPGVAVDRYADALVVTTHTPRLPDGLLPALVAAAQPQAIYLKRRPPESARLTEADIAALAPAEPAWGEAVPELTGRENGLAYRIRPGAGLHAGLFLDMREVRARVRDWAAGRTVLNTFAYTCAFGVAASAGGATRVLNIDLSRSTLAWGQDNYIANGLTPDPYDFVYGDVFDWLGRLARQSRTIAQRAQTFDLLILDPPSFARSRGQIFRAAQDYGRLVTLAAPVLAPGGLLLACCNLAQLSLDAFRRQVMVGLTAAGRTGRIIATHHEPTVDFPVAPGEHPYLKVLALEV